MWAAASEVTETLAYTINQQLASILLRSTTLILISGIYINSFVSTHRSKSSIQRPGDGVIPYSQQFPYKQGRGTSVSGLPSFQPSGLNPSLVQFCILVKCFCLVGNVSLTCDNVPCVTAQIDGEGGQRDLWLLSSWNAAQYLKKPHSCCPSHLSPLASPTFTVVPLLQQLACSPLKVAHHRKMPSG